jgi:site-specific DNA-cytosine methylase
MLMLDLFAGRKGASRAMVARGWTVVTVDIDPSYEPDIVGDLRRWSWNGPRPDLLWASPPCDEFSRWFMPWRAR